MMPRPICSSWRHPVRKRLGPVSGRSPTWNLSKRKAGSVRLFYFHNIHALLHIAHIIQRTSHCFVLHSRRLFDCRYFCHKTSVMLCLRASHFVVLLFSPPSHSVSRYARSSLSILCRLRNPFRMHYFAPAHVSCFYSVTLVFIFHRHYRPFA